MSKELDYLDKILNYQPLTLVERTIIECIKEKIQRLEAIDNANPSEALECLNCLERLHDCGVFNYEEMEDYNIIKNYILTAQEPKHYLKWEDLEFDRKEKIIKVKLGDNVYHLVVGLTDGGNNLVTFHTELKRHYFTDTDKQFFNDLHLERVEENE